MRIMSVTHWYCSCCWAVLTASQGPFSFSPHQQGGWGTQEAGRGHSQDNWPQGYSRPHEIMLRIKTRGKASQGLLLRNWPGISEWEVRSCILHHLGNNDDNNNIPSFSVLLNCIYCNPWIFLFFPILSPISLLGQWMSGCGEFSCHGDIPVSFHVCVEQSVHSLAQRWMYVVLFLQTRRIRGARMLCSKIWNSTFTFSSSQLHV